MVNYPEVLDAAFRTNTLVLGRIAMIAACGRSKSELWNWQHGAGRRGQLLPSQIAFWRCQVPKLAAASMLNHMSALFPGDKLVVSGTFDDEDPERVHATVTGSRYRAIEAGRIGQLVMAI